MKKVTKNKIIVYGKNKICREEVREAYINTSLSRQDLVRKFRVITRRTRVIYAGARVSLVYQTRFAGQVQATRGMRSVAARTAYLDSLVFLLLLFNSFFFRTFASCDVAARVRAEGSRIYLAEIESLHRYGIYSSFSK